MPPVVLLVFFGFVGIEIAGFIFVGEWLGFWPTLALTILSASVGMFLMRHQGIAALRRLQDAIEQNRPPMPEVFDGFMLLAAGGLLFVPGFFSDAVGLILFLPPLRKGLLPVVVRGMKPPREAGASDRGIVIDGVYVDLTTPPPSEELNNVLLPTK